MELIRSLLMILRLAITIGLSSLTIKSLKL
nr:MAG TPA: hypothetical protein [Caudoviricetes sp.]